MNDILTYLTIAIVALSITSVLVIFILKSKKKSNYNKQIDKTNELVKLLGGLDNIEHYESKGSRFKVTLKNVELAQKEKITELGAKGIMEIGNTLQIIVGEDAKILADIVKNIEK